MSSLNFGRIKAEKNSQNKTMNKRKLAHNEADSCIFSKRANIAAEKGTLKENVIQYYLMPSLEHLAAVRIVITLWTRADIQVEIEKLYRRIYLNCGRQEIYYNNCSIWKELRQEINHKLLSMVPELSEFDVIRKILSGLVNPIGQEIFDWIEYQDGHVFQNYFPDENSAVNCLESLVWTSRGIIDYEGTAKALLAKKQLTDMDNYYLACTYCLEDEIAVIAPSVLSRIRCFNALLTRAEDKIMVCFWNAHLTRDFAKLTRDVSYYNMKYETNFSINECIFHRLVRKKKHRNNQVAIKFMWNMLSDEEKSRQIKSAIKHSKADIKCFFLSQMNEAQQQQIFKAESREILLCLLDDWLWKDYFLPSIHHVWSVISGLDFLRIVEDIVGCRMERHYGGVGEYNRYKAILKELWRSAPKHLKEFIFEFQNGSRVSGIFFGLLCAKNIDMIQLMFPAIDDAQKKYMIFPSLCNYLKCYSLLLTDQIDVVKMYIDNSFFAEKDVAVFKQKFVEDYGNDIAVHFIQSQKWEEVEEFMRWAFQSDRDIKDFKVKLSYSKVCDDILRYTVENNDEGGFIELERFYQWCASGCLIKVFEFKHDMYRVYFTRAHRQLIQEDKYELLEQLLKWGFSNDELKVERIKRNFHVCYEYIQIVQLVLNLLQQNNRLQSLEKFVRWCYTTNGGVVRFKKWILEPGKGNTEGVCIKLLCQGMFKLADDFVQWCNDSSEKKIIRFKNKLMVCDYIVHLFVRIRHCHDEKMLGKVMEWFNPSAELIIRFREKFRSVRWLEDWDIAAHFIRNEKWGEVDKFITWAFQSDKDKREFKKELSYSKICEDIFESIVANNNEGGFTELENFFQWCSSGSTRNDFELQREIWRENLYDLCFMEVIFSPLIQDDKYQLLEQFLNWFYPNNEQQTELIKRSFYVRFKYFQVVQLVLNLVEKNDQLQSLEKFVSWCFPKNTQIDGFKKWILKPGREGKESVCITLLGKGMFKLGNEFVDWCCSASQMKITQFKNKLMLSDYIEDLFKRHRNYERMLKYIIEWFNPSTEIIDQFRKKFKHLWKVSLSMSVRNYTDIFSRIPRRNLL